jgi:hypothetical protein
MIKPQSFEKVESQVEIQIDAVDDKEFWKNVFSVLKENGTV